MAARFNLVLSDDLNKELDRVVDQSETSKSEILRKALQLYLAARQGKEQGMKIGLVDPKTLNLKTEIVGL
jgi:metal-responsive CopG/Arc/MetJ family transcriptional regulator